MRKECRFNGYGGQGIILAGIILAEAAGVYEGQHVVQVQDYGPAARGDSSTTDVIISDSTIDFPKATRLDLLVALSQRGFEQHNKFLRENGTIIADSDNVHPGSSKGVRRFPLTEIACEQTGGPLGVSIVALGATVALTGIVKLESVKKSMLERVPGPTKENNLAALMAGYTVAHDRKKRKA
ncbi:MAG: 2-oxoacid:acceptor oxidoreductase family protein [Candidatus Hydrogenedentota bacterium]|nr:MAG: 2-oxoacid:acceptor oxidoreductase family protein [Candidatus Hydrogenedentota bacterium]